MSKMEALNDVQRSLASSNIDIVKWVISDHIEVNKSICGLSYDDLFQEGCLWLCKAATTYDGKKAQFKTYARIVVKNGLLTYCKKMCRKQKKLINLNDMPVDSEDGGNETFTDEATYNSLISEIDTFALLDSVKSEYSGIARLGIEALELKTLGYSGADIALLWGVEQNHIGAWISRAKKKLMKNENFILGLR